MPDYGHRLDGIYYPGGLRSLSQPPVEDIDAITADDETLDAIVAGSDMDGAERARVLRTLADRDPDDRLHWTARCWRSEVREAPTPELVDVDTAMAVIAAARPSRPAVWRPALLTLLLVAVAVTLLLAGCGSPPAPAAPPRPSDTPSALSLLAPLGQMHAADPPAPPALPQECAGLPSLVVCPQALSTRSTAGVPAYRREAFGRDWARVHGNCDTREVVLERDAGPAARDDDRDGCRDDAPVLDPYTGRMTAAPQADVDHVFSLKAAWVAGAWRWTPTQRSIFSNDQANLRAVGFSINRSKGDRGPDEWEPPTCEGRHVFARIYRATSVRWALPLTPAEDAALVRMAAPC